MGGGGANVLRKKRRHFDCHKTTFLQKVFSLSLLSRRVITVFNFRNAITSTVRRLHFDRSMSREPLTVTYIEKRQLYRKNKRQHFTLCSRRPRHPLGRPKYAIIPFDQQSAVQRKNSMKPPHATLAVPSLRFVGCASTCVRTTISVVRTGAARAARAYRFASRSRGDSVVNCY